MTPLEIGLISRNRQLVVRVVFFYLYWKVSILTTRFIGFCSFIVWKIAKNNDQNELTFWTLEKSCGLTYNLWRVEYDFVGLENKLALGVWRKALVQQQNLRAVRRTQLLPPKSPSMSARTAPSIPYVAHFDAKGKLVPWIKRLESRG